MKKLAILGASYLQAPLILRAREMGLETHVFAWAANDVGEKLADHFYPVSIVEKEEILVRCRALSVDGIVSIASDLAAVTVNYVASRMGLTGNSDECAFLSTNKHAMREAFARNGDPSPRSIRVAGAEELDGAELRYPVVVKPTDRSGSRGITRLDGPEGLAEAVARARELSFEKKALVEEFAPGREYSVECLSWQGEHRMLAVTKKYTTGAPGFVETGHLQPAPLEAGIVARIRETVFHALTSLKIRNGASHSELKVDGEGTIRLIEIGGRMGGDMIGSDLVRLSTGIDYTEAVIRTALGQRPDLRPASAPAGAAGIRFILGREDLDALERLRKEHPARLVRAEVRQPDGTPVTDSGSRFGYFLMAAPDAEALRPYLPREEES